VGRIVREATRRFSEWLESEVARLPVGAGIPGDAELARAHGLSRKTVEKVVRSLAARGVVWRRPGKGTFKGVSPAPSSVSPLQPRRSAGADLAEALLASIADGSLKRGEALPSVKYMARQFHVSPSAVSAAYRHLRQRGLLTRIGRTCWLGGMGRAIHPQLRKLVAFVVNTPDQLVSAFQTDLYAESFRRLELTLSLSGYFLRAMDAATFVELCRRWPVEGEFPYGVVLFCQDHHTLPSLLPPLNALRSHRSAPSIPVVIDWNWTVFREFPSDAFIVSRPNLTTTTARTLAEFLAERGLTRARLVLGWRHLFGRAPYPWDFGDALKVLVELRHLVASPDFGIDLVGIPVRLTVGKGFFADGDVEVKLRRGTETLKIKKENLIETLKGIIEAETAPVHEEE